MVTIMFVVNTMNAKSGLRNNIAVFSGAEGAINKMISYCLLIRDHCPDVEAFKINSANPIRPESDEGIFVNEVMKKLNKAMEIL